MVRVPDEVKKVSVDDLVLDLDNFRFPVGQASEEMAFNYLFQEEEVMDLARSLLVDGYLTNDLPLVLREGGRYVVLEANRRVCALRALRDPDLAPAYSAQLRTLTRRHQEDLQDLPAEVYVTVFPDRASAAPVLARQHIGQDKKRWGLDEQANFVMAQLSGDADVAYLKETLTGIKNITRLVKMAEVRRLISDLPFKDPEVAEYAKSSKLKMSAFEYAYKSRDIQALLGLSFDAEGRILSKPTSSSEIAVMERLLSGFSSGELSTRKVLNAKRGQEFQDLLKHLRRIGSASTPQGEGGVPFSQEEGAKAASADYVPSGEGSPRDSGGTGQALLDPDKGPEKRGPNHPATKVTLDLGGLDSISGAASISSRLIELRSINLKSHPVSAALLLRAVVEGLGKEHYARKADTVSGELGAVVKKLVKDYSSTRPIIQSVQLLNNARGPKPGSLAWFNAAAHSLHVVVTRDEVHQAFQELLPLLRFLTESLGPAVTTGSPGTAKQS